MKPVSRKTSTHPACLTCKESAITGYGSPSFARRAARSNRWVVNSFWVSSFPREWCAERGGGGTGFPPSLWKTGRGNPRGQPQAGCFLDRERRETTGARLGALRSPCDGAASRSGNATTIFQFFFSFDHLPVAISFILNLPPNAFWIWARGVPKRRDVDSSLWAPECVQNRTFTADNFERIRGHCS